MAPLIPVLTIGKIILTIPLDSYSEPWFWKVMRGFLDDDDPKPYCALFFSSEPNASNMNESNRQFVLFGIYHFSDDILCFGFIIVG